MASLGERIAKLTNPTPEVLDPEDAANFEPVPKSSDAYLQEDDEETSDLRRRTAPLLEDIDPLYAGRKVARKKLGHIFRADKAVTENDDESMDDLSGSVNSNDDESLNDEDDNLDQDDDDNLDEYDDKFREQLEEKMQKMQKSLDSSCVEDEEDSSDEEDVENSESGDMTQQFSNIDVSNEIEKGQAIKNQKEIWNRLLETRIKLQKLLIISNKLPQAELWKALKEKGGKELAEALKKATRSVDHTMKSWVNLQSELVSKNKEMTCTNSLENKKSINKSDEEIPSDSDEEMVDEKESIGKKRKLKTEEYDTVLEKRFKSLTPYRNSVIQKWDEKTRLSTGRMTQKSFSGFDNSALKQIEQIIQDKTRLIRRTQLKRSLYRVLGKSEETQTAEDENANTETQVSKQDMLLKDYDSEIFDDDDFYRLLLKDVIESKSFGIDAAVIRKQMEIQKIRNKMKRKVDTKASKGRKLRYDVHPKLVNFMAPVQSNQISDEARESFLKCLFGGKN